MGERGTFREDGNLLGRQKVWKLSEKVTLNQSQIKIPLRVKG